MSKEIEAAVDALLQQHAIQVVISGGQPTTKETWECDAWRVTVSKGKSQFTTDYFTGIGHRSEPASMFGARPYAVNTLAWHAWQATRKPVTPHPASIFYSLILDASALDDNFGDWCASFGYDEDSLKALNTYTQCCKIGRDLRSTLGRDVVKQLEKLLEDY